ncbi:MAG: hypothetical protein K6F30_05360 [Lachnospiraceae bacterium]|nr:hypothetical protein [Lachnospiraceae bacterium]
MLPGVFLAKKKSGEVYYRTGITKYGKHISLGSFSTEEEAHEAYLEAGRIYEDDSIDTLNLKSHLKYLSFEKGIVLLNHRDYKTYFKTPIYLRQGYFSYFLEGVGELKFDNDDLFYYSSHRILIHDGHLYVNDYGMQYGILARFGIKNFAVAGKDYTFANGDSLDFRYSNVVVVNKYHGVTYSEAKEVPYHEAHIHINGEYIIGRYSTDCEAAVAYNKAVDAAVDAGIEKNFIQNYVLEYTPKEYADVYTEIQLPEKYLSYLNKHGKLR